MSVLAIVAIVVGVLLILFFIGGLFGVRARARGQAATFPEHVRAADEALEQARALDRGWERETMEAVARAAVTDARPGWTFDELHLVLVDDRPGMDEDRAHFVAMGPEDQVRVILARHGGQWVAEDLE
jgi:hypothetical protein